MVFDSFPKAVQSDSTSWFETPVAHLMHLEPRVLLSAVTEFDISYSLGAATNVSLVVQDTNGNVLRELLRGQPQDAGAHTIKWDGLDNDGNPVAQGDYTWKLLESDGLTSEYQFTLGTNPPYGEPYGLWTGDIGGVATVAVDANGVYFGASIAENNPLITALSPDLSTLLWDNGQKESLKGSGERGPISMAVDGGELYYVVFNNSTVMKVGAAGGGQLKTWNKGDKFDGQKVADLDVYGSNFVAVFQEDNQVRWLDKSNANTRLSVALTDPTGVTVIGDGDDGKVLVLTEGGTKLVELSFNSPNPTTVISSGLTNATRIDVDHTTGDLIISDVGTHQILRYNDSYQLQDTYGASGGRSYGTYNPKNFFDVLDVTADGNGSFWVSEKGAPRRTALFNYSNPAPGENGYELLEDLYGGQGFFSHYSLDPTNSNRVWAQTEGAGIIGFDVDWTNKAWTVAETYSYSSINDGIFFKNSGSGGFQVISSDGNTTRLRFGNRLAIIELDAAAGTLKPVALFDVAEVGGGGKDTPASTGISGYPQPWIDAIVAEGYVNGSGNPTPGSAPKGFYWGDTDGDGIMDASEFTLYATEFSGNWTAMFADDFNFDYLVAQDGPDTTAYYEVNQAGVTGVNNDIPVWSWDQIVAGPAIPANAYEGAGSEYTFKRGLWKDASGNVYLTVMADIFSLSMSGVSIGNEVNSARLIKFDSNGDFAHSVLRHTSREPFESRQGRVSYPLHIMNNVNGTLTIADRTINGFVAVTEDGLYVGAPFDNRANDGLPDEVYQWGNPYWTVQFDMLAGSLVERNGEHFWMAAGQNNSPVFKITGLDDYSTQTGTVSVNAEPQTAARRGSGLIGYYYDNEDFTDLVEVREDPQVFFNWQADPPIGVMDKDYFSVRWVGEIEPEFSEEYTFYFQQASKDGVQLWIDDQLVIDALTSSNQNPTGQVFLQAGRKYAIRIDYVDTTGNARADLQWESQTVERQRIKSESLYRPPVLVMDFNEDGGSELINSVGSGVAGDHYNATRVDGPVGSGALAFNGTDSFARIRNDVTLTPTDQLTVAAFVRSDTVNWNATEALLSMEEGYKLYGTQGTRDITFSAYIEGQWVSATYTPSAIDDAYHQYVGTYDGFYVRLYMDGQLVSTKSMNGSMNGVSSDLLIGRNVAGTQHFDGRIDNVRVYDYALAEDGVSGLYTQLTGTSLVRVEYIDSFAAELGPNVGVVRVLRTGSSESAITVNLSYSGTAVAGTDYETPPSSVVIPVGESYVDVVIRPIDDPDQESTETVEVNVQSGTGYFPGTITSDTIGDVMLLFDGDLIQQLESQNFDSGAPADWDRDNNQKNGFVNFGATNYSATNDANGTASGEIKGNWNNTSNSGFSVFYADQTMPFGVGTINTPYFASGRVNVLNASDAGGDAFRWPAAFFTTVEKAAQLEYNTGKAIGLRLQDGQIGVGLVNATNSVDQFAGIDLVANGLEGEPLDFEFQWQPGLGRLTATLTQVNAPQQTFDITLDVSAGEVKLFGDHPFDSFGATQFRQHGFVAINPDTSQVRVDDLTYGFKIDPSVLPRVRVEAVDADAAERSGETGAPDGGYFRIHRGVTTTGSLTVNYTLSGSASSGNDYAALTGTTTIAANDTYVDVPLTILGDTLDEGDENVILTISDDAAYNVEVQNSAEIIVVDDDLAPNTIGVVATTPTTDEGSSTPAQWTFTRLGDTSQNEVIHFSLVTESEEGVDFSVSSSSSVTILAGQTTATLDLTSLVDQLVEADETIRLAIAPTVRQIGGFASDATVTILDNDRPAGWDGAADVGPLSTPGTTTQSNGTWTLTAHGGPFDGNGDEFHYAYQSLAGDFEFITRVNSLSEDANGKPNANAGIMVRQSLDGQDQMVSLGMSRFSRGDVLRAARTSAGGDPTKAWKVAGLTTSPAWLRLTRTGDLFEAFYSTDGSTWSSHGKSTVAMDEQVYVGLYASNWESSSGSPANALDALVAEFDNVSVTTSGEVVDVQATNLLAEEENLDTGRFTIARKNGTTGDLRVFYQVTGTAIAGIDYQALSTGYVDIPDGQDSVDVVVTPLDDSLFEFNESVVMTLVEDPTYVISSKGTSATVMIVDNEAGQVIRLADSSELRAVENSSDEANFVIERREASDTELVVNYTISGTATPGVDYTALSGTATIPAGETQVVLSISDIDDTNVFEDDETIVLTLSTDAAYVFSTGETTQQTAVLADDELPAEFTVADISTVPSAGTAQLSNGTWTITGGGNNAFHEPVDQFSYTYQSLSGDGEVVARIVSVEGPNNAAIAGIMLRDGLGAGATMATGMMRTDAKYYGHRREVLDADAKSVSKGSLQFPMWVKIVRTGDLIDQYYSADGQTWTAATSTKTVPMSTDVLVGLAISSDEPDEMATAVIDNYVVKPVSSSAFVSVAATTAIANESGPTSGIATFSRDAASASPLIVQYAITGGSASSSDYSTTPTLTGSVTIAANQTDATIDFTPIVDSLWEGNENVVISVIDGDGYRTGGGSSADITIYDNYQPFGLIAMDTFASGGNSGGSGWTSDWVMSGTNAKVFNEGLADAYSDEHVLRIKKDTNAQRSTDVSVRTNNILLQFRYQVDLDAGETATITLNDGSGANKTVLQYTDADNTSGWTVAQINISEISGLDLESGTLNLIASVEGDTGADVLYIDDLHFVEESLPSVDVITLDNVALENGTDTATFRVSRSGDIANALTVNISTSGLASPSDYIASPVISGGSVDIPAGESYVDITITPVDDVDIETLEDLVLTVQAQAGIYNTGASPVASVNIISDDVSTITLSADTSAINESSAGGTFTVTRSGPGDLTSNALTILYNLDAASTADGGIDFQALNGTVTIAAGQTSATIDIIPIDDSNVEGDETVVLDILDALEYDLGVVSNDTMTITDDDALTVEIVANDPLALEPGTDSGQFTITRNSNSGVLTVNYMVLGSSTATPDVDYVALSGSVQIADGQTTATIDVTALDDSDIELNESVIVQLTSGSYAIGTNNTATVEVGSDDAPTVALTAIDVTASETGPDAGVFRVTRSGSGDLTGTDLVVNYTINGSSTAANGVDYQLLAGSVTIPAGQTSVDFNITPIDDNDAEADETVTIDLAAGAYTIDVQDNSGSVTIADDDAGAETQIAFDDFESGNVSGGTGAWVTDWAEIDGAKITDLNTPTNSGAYHLRLRTDNDVAERTVDLSAISSSAKMRYYYRAYSFEAGETAKVLVDDGSGAGFVLVAEYAEPQDDNLYHFDEIDLSGFQMSNNFKIRVEAHMSGTSDRFYIDDIEIVGFIAPPLPEVSVVATDATATEPGDSDRGTFQITRTGDLSQALEVFYTISGDAASGVDYAALSGSVIIGAQLNSVNITVTPLDDTIIEADESVTLAIDSVSGVYEASSTSGSDTVTVVSDDKPTVDFVLSSATIDESPSTPATLTVVRSGTGDLTSQPLTVKYSVDVGFSTATEGTDFQAMTGEVVILAGQTTADITLTPIADTDFEGNEIILITLDADAAYNLGTNTVDSVVITDDDVLTVSVSATTPSADENGLVNGVFTITRNTTVGDLDVDYTLSGTAALLGVDYDDSLLTGTATILNGHSSVTVTITPVDDALIEENETVVLTIQPNTDYSIGTASDTVTIASDDLPTVSLTANDASADETDPDAGQFTVTRTGIGNLINEDLVVYYTVGGTASDGDYTEDLSSGQVTIVAGQTSATINITPIDDSVDDDNETVILTLVSNAAYIVGTPSNDTVTIIDNDDAPTIVTLASDDFETGDGTGGTGWIGDWTFTDTASIRSDTPYEGTYHVRLRGGGTVDEVSRVVNLSGVTNASITYWYKPESIEAGEFVQVLIDDGAGETVVAQYDDTDAAVWTQATIDLSSYTMNSEFKIIFRATGINNSGDYLYIDAVEVLGDIDESLPVVSISATDATGSENGGDTLTYRISRTGDTSNALTVSLINIGEATGSDVSESITSVTIGAGNTYVDLVLTPVDDSAAEQTEDLHLKIALDNTKYRIDSSGISATGIIADNDDSVIVSDGFESGDGTGGVGWLGDWNLSNSTIQSSNGPSEGSYHLRVRGANEQATRAADLSDLSSATLSFDYKASSIEAGESFRLQVRANGGGWVTIWEVFDGDDTNTYTSASIDISAYLYDDFEIRFDAQASGTNDKLWIDDIQISGS